MRRPVFVERGAAAVVIDARVAPRDGGWVVEIVVRDAGGAELGARELVEPSASCRDLDETVALVVALIVDPEGGGRRAPAPPPQPPPPPTPRPPSRPWAAGVELRGLAAWGLLPGAAVGASLAVTLEGPRGPPVVLRASLWREDEARNADGAVDIRLVTGGLLVCPARWRRGRATFDACGGGELARLAARGAGFDRSERATLFGAYAVVEPRVAIRLGRRVTAGAGAAAWIPVVRPALTYDQAGTPMVLYRAAAVAVVVQAGVGLHF